MSKNKIGVSESSSSTQAINFLFAIKLTIGIKSEMPTINILTYWAFSNLSISFSSYNHASTASRHGRVFRIRFDHLKWNSRILWIFTNNMINFITLHQYATIAIILKFPLQVKGSGWYRKPLRTSELVLIRNLIWFI